MTTKRSYLSKVLSVCMAVIMCLSVFVLDWSNLAPKADAISQGSWKFRVYANVYNTDGDANGPTFAIGNHGTWSCSARNGGDQWANSGYYSTSWPSYIRVTASTRNPNIGFHWYFQVYNNLNGSWVTIQSGNWDDTRGKSGTDDRNASYDTGNLGINGAPYVYARGINQGSATVTANNYGGATQTKGYSAYCYDQYGVNRPASVSWSIPTNYNGLYLSSSSGDSTTVYIPAASGQGNHNNTIRANIGGTNYNVNLTVNNNYYYIDLNGTLDGTSSGNISGYGKANVVVNGSTVGSSVTDYYTSHPSGSTYSITNAGADSGRAYIGGAVSNQRLVGSNVAVVLDYRTNSTLTIAPNSGTWNGHTTNQSYTKYWNQTLSVPNPTKDGWVWDGWSATGSTIGSLSGTTFTFNTTTTGQSETLTAKWHRGITNTYHWLKADATTDQSATVSGTAYDTATTLALTAPTNTATTVAKNDKTWTFKGWNETDSVTWGGATQTASVGNGASHNVATTSSAHTFYPVYALATTKFYANYNILKDGEDTYTPVQKNVTVNGDATTGAMPVPTGSDNGSGADVAKYYSKGAYIYELKGWAPTNYTLGEGTETIPYGSSTATLNVPGAGTPSSTANTTPIELYPVYALYATAIHTHFNYIKADGTTAFLDVSGQALTGQTTGTVTFPGADQVNTSYTKDGVTYTLVGWNIANNTDAYAGFGSTAQHAVLADPANDYYTYYPIYTCTTTARYNYYAANGAPTSLTKATTLYKYDTFTPTTADVAIATSADVNNTITLDGRTFTFKGWRKDTSNAAMNIAATGTENHAITDTEYQYYAIYSNDKLALSYNGINGAPVPATQYKTQYINAGTGNANINNASELTFDINPANVTPEKTGYTYIGWQDTNNAEQETATYAKTGTTLNTKINKTLYAVYSINDMAISFTYWNGTGYKTDTKYIKYDDSTRSDSGAARYKVNSNAISKTPIDHSDAVNHYYFNGWVLTNGTATLTANSDGSVVTVGKALTDATVQATYKSVAHHWVNDLTKDHVDPTCTEDGYYYRYCSDCGFVEEHAVIEATGHEMAFESYKAPTCTKEGRYAVSVCNKCGLKSTDEDFAGSVYYDFVNGEFVAVASDTDVIPALGHNFVIDTTVGENGVVAPTCTTKGYTAYVCTNNPGHTEKRELVDELGHEEKTVPGKAATCTEAGYTEKTYCEVCDAVIVDSNVIPAKGHKLVIDPAVAVTCTTDGLTEGRHCSECDYVEAQEVIAHEGHKFVVTEAEPATCTKPGHTGGSVCSVCGAIEEGSTAVETEPALGHDWDDGVYTASEKPCLTPGYTTFTCARCNETKVEYDEIAAHTPVIVEAQAATCSTKGWEEYTACSVCGTAITTKVELPVLAHEWVSNNDEVAATCTEKGATASFHCANCDAVKAAEEVAALGHEFGEWTLDTLPTCTEAGKRVRTCIHEGCEEKEYKILEAIGHNMTAHAAKEATCTADGNAAYYTCSRCEGVVYADAEGTATLENVVIPATGHTWEENIVAPTCTAKGYTVKTCACGATEKGDYVDALGHTGGKADCSNQAICERCGKAYGGYGSHSYTTNTVAGTCVERGKTVKTCAICGKSSETPTEYGDHQYVTVASSAATCTEKGVISRKCELCGDEITVEVAATGNHTDADGDGYCDGCGKVIPGSVADHSGHCDKCGMNHSKDGGLFGYNGLFCKIIAFFRNLFA